MKANAGALVVLVVVVFMSLVFFAGYRIGWREGWAEPYRVDGRPITVYNNGTWEFTK